MTRVHLARVLSSAGLNTILVPGWLLALTDEKPQLPYFFRLKIKHNPTSIASNNLSDPQLTMLLRFHDHTRSSTRADEW